jgi:hypothetical protein
MPQDFDHGRSFRSAPQGATLRLVLAAAALALLVAVHSPARAADDDSEAQATTWTKFMQTLGLKKAPEVAGTEAGINYRERPPLVVPPSRDLPQPGADAASLPADWPKGPAQSVKHTKAKTAVVPDTAVQTPNPPFQKKPWYNPAGWFDKEEYATFAGEPVRSDLTDPPAGYRVPSPEQPYGIAPDKKTSNKATMANPTGLQPATPPK